MLGHLSFHIRNAMIYNKKYIGIHQFESKYNSQHQALLIKLSDDKKIAIMLTSVKNRNHPYIHL